MNLRMRRSFCLLLLTVPLWGQPMIERMRPHGAQVGTAVRLVLEGQRLGPAPRLQSDVPSASTPLTAANPQGMMPPSELVYLIEVDQDAEPGVYPLRIETAEGLSNTLLFTVGTFAQVQELESEPDADPESASNDFRKTAQPIEAPVTVEGRLEGAERDLFRFRATAGRKLVAEVTARRIGSAIDPNLELLNSEGRTLARSADARGLGLDARISFEAPADGEYFLAIRDERFSSQKQDFYRLTLGEYSFAESVFPLGWTRGNEVEVEFFGGNLQQPLKRTVHLDDVPANSTETRVGVPGTPSSVPFLLSDGAEVLESASGGVLREGVVLNGRIAQAGEIDRFRLAVNGGEQWALDLRSGELPGSSLYGVMTITGGGEVLAVAGKHAGDPNPYVITTTGETATYPFVNLTVPPEVQELTVSVEDLLGRGGPAYSYRLTARKQGPDFLLTINEPYLNIPRNGSAILTVTAERRGYFGPIELYIENLPADLEVSGGHIPPMSTLGNTLPRFATGRLTLTAKPEATIGAMHLTVRGRMEGTEEGGLDRRATGPGMRVNVQGTEQPAVKAEWLGYGLPVRINPDQAGRLEFLTPRELRLVRGGQGQLAKWGYTSIREDARLTKKVDLPRNFGSVRLRRLEDGDDAKSGGFRLFTHERTSLGKVDLNLTATVEVDGRKETLVSQPLEIDVVDGYTLAAPERSLVLGTDRESLWEGSIWRDPEFQRTVTVSAVGLPLGVACEQAELAAGQTRYALPCTAGANAPEGEHEIEIRAESVLSDEGTTPYVAEPAKTTLVIER